MSENNLFQFEENAWKKFRHVAGIDEAGRGAWAGPVVAAAVIFEPGVTVEGVNDSKKLTPQKRDFLFDKIKKHALTYGIGIVQPSIIDDVNILEATKLAMLEAVSQLNPMAEHILIDGNALINTEISQEFVIDGDAKSFSIGAASILAKVTRDRLMEDLAKEYPAYAFERHKGYGTKVHKEALKAHGVSDIHRKSYKPVAELL